MAKLKKLPNIGRVFSKAVYCYQDGTPTITYHNVKVDNIYIPKKNPKMESYATLVSNEFHGYILVKVYIMDLDSWRFIK